MKLIKNAGMNQASSFIFLKSNFRFLYDQELNTGSSDQFLQLVFGFQNLITSLNRWFCKMLSVTQFVHDTNTSMFLLVALESTIYRLSFLYIDNDHICYLISGAQRYINLDFPANKIKRMR